MFEDPIDRAELVASRAWLRQSPYCDLGAKMKNIIVLLQTSVWKYVMVGWSLVCFVNVLWLLPGFRILVYDPDRGEGPFYEWSQSAVGYTAACFVIWLVGSAGILLVGFLWVTFSGLGQTISKNAEPKSKLVFRDFSLKVLAGVATFLITRMLFGEGISGSGVAGLATVAVLALILFFS